MGTFLACNVFGPTQTAGRNAWAVNPGLIVLGERQTPALCEAAPVGAGPKTAFEFDEA
ncbi:hypothetical protein [Acanthopleuribacter pedis]|uniref:Uncharacterized protein n=1 Tax=Acanthopleuribacter pedis TaxID=442870 RepID=A0A8J7PYB3_9BACT|nr:hypothetical protein [Acanthopleuribacter pedis]MBO1316882.1 hypothetical protein [Acanthopleuribacter pedis]